MRLSQSTVWLFRFTFLLSVTAIIYLAFTPNANPVSGAFNDKVNHAIAFFTLMFLIDFSFPHFGIIWQKWFPIIFFAIGIEIVQSYFPYRQFSLYDIAADFIGMLIYILSLPLFKSLPLLKKRWIPSP
ncbi:MAG: VanZ family protein [Pseudomonadota bacterium]